MVQPYQEPCLRLDQKNLCLSSSAIVAWAGKIYLRGRYIWWPRNSQGGNSYDCVAVSKSCDMDATIIFFLRFSHTSDIFTMDINSIVS